jgi:heme-NO-binding protein
VRRAVHGVIFASFRDYITSLDPEQAQQIMAGEPAYLMSETYPDERLIALIERASEITGKPADELVHDFGVFAAHSTFARLYPAFFTVAGNTRSFLLTVEDRIHELVRATIPNAQPPQLVVEPLGDDGVVITYTSERKLCTLLEGLVTGTARHYGEQVSIVQVTCMRDGDDACCFEVRLSPGPAS